MQKSHLTGIILVIFAAACWGSTGILTHKIIEKSALSTIGVAFWRDLLSSLVLLFVILIFNPKLLIVERKDLPWLIGMGVISIGTFHIFWNQSIVLLGASLTTVLQYNAPIIVTITARFLFDEPLTARKILSIFLAALGTILVTGIFTTGDWHIQPYSLLIAFLSTITYSSLSLFGKKLSQDYNPWTIMFYIFAIGTLTIFIYQGGTPDPLEIGSGYLIWILGLLLLATIFGFGAFTTGLTYLPASIASITTTSEILFASIFAYYYLGEQLGVWQIAGAFLIISGVILASLSKNTNK